MGDSNKNIDSIMENITSKHINSVIPDSSDNIESLLGFIGKTDFGCMYCGDTGITNKGESCSNCNKEEKDKDIIVKIKRENELPFKIPSRYEESLWEFEKAIKINPKFTSRMTFRNFCIELNKILKRSEEGTLQKNKTIISAAKGLGVRRWAYTVLHYSYLIGLSVNPIKILNELKIEDSDKNNVLIIMVTKYNFQYNMDKLDHILTLRESKDFTTIVITNVDLRFFVSPLDGKLIHFDKILEYNN